MKANARRRGLWALALLLIPTMAWANAGTPLMWVTLFHLTIGNILIAVLEAAILAFAFKARFWRSFIWLLAANYVTAFLGGFLLAMLPAPFEGVLLGNASPSMIPIWMVESFAVTWAATVVGESPFVFFAFAKNKRSWGRAIVASLVLQTASYIPLAWLYASTTETSLLTRTMIEKDAAVFAAKPLGMVYYLSGSDVRRCHTDGSADEVFLHDVTGLPNADEMDQIYFRPKEDNSGKLELMGYARNQRPHMLADSISGISAHSRGTTASGGVDVPWTGMYAAMCFDDGADRKAFPGWHGVRAGGQYYILETPSDSWWADSLTVLPSGQITFRCGEYVVLLDPETRQLSVIAKGQSPVVLYAAEDLILPTPDQPTDPRSVPSDRSD